MKYEGSAHRCAVVATVWFVLVSAAGCPDPDPPATGQDAVSDSGADSDVAGDLPSVDADGGDSDPGPDADADAAIPDVSDTPDDGGVCVPDCAGKQCGDDGCGGSCGGCSISGYGCGSAGSCLPFEELASDGYNVCGVLTDGSVDCPGGYAPDYDLPQIASGLGMGDGFACGLTASGAVLCGGAVPGSQPPVGAAAQLSVGEDHGCVLRSTGALTCFGDNGFGQTDPPAGTFTQVSSGDGWSCALRDDQKILCWGRDDFGQLDVPDLAYTYVEAGRFRSSCGITTWGGLVCWGSGITNTPTACLDQVDAGEWTLKCGIDPNGAVHCWSSSALCFDGCDTPEGTFTSVVAGDGDWGCALSTEGVVKCWGARSYGPTSASGPALEPGCQAPPECVAACDHAYSDCVASACTDWSGGDDYVADALATCYLECAANPDGFGASDLAAASCPDVVFDACLDPQVGDNCACPWSQPNPVTNVGAACAADADCDFGDLPATCDLQQPDGYCTAECTIDAACGPDGVCWWDSLQPQVCPGVPVSGCCADSETLMTCDGPIDCSGPCGWEAQLGIFTCGGTDPAPAGLPVSCDAYPDEPTITCRQACAPADGQWGCRAGYTCDVWDGKGVCLPACATDGDCAGGETCDAALATCVPTGQAPAVAGDSCTAAIDVDPAALPAALDVTAGASSPEVDLGAICGGFGTKTGVDVVWTFEPVVTGTYTLAFAGEPVDWAVTSSCAPDAGCQRGTAAPGDAATVSLTAGERVFLIIDSVESDASVTLSDVCEPACDGKTCGSDGCGGTCGACPDGEACGGDGACVTAGDVVGNSCANPIVMDPAPSSIVVPLTGWTDEAPMFCTGGQPDIVLSFDPAEPTTVTVRVVSDVPVRVAVDYSCSFGCDAEAEGIGEVSLIVDAAGSNAYQVIVEPLVEPPPGATATVSIEEGCVPSCAGSGACGDDGCGGSCGTCPSLLACDPGLGSCAAAGAVAGDTCEAAEVFGAPSTFFHLTGVVGDELSASVPVEPPECAALPYAGPAVGPGTPDRFIQLTPSTTGIYQVSSVCGGTGCGRVYLRDGCGATSSCPGTEPARLTAGEPAIAVVKSSGLYDATVELLCEADCLDRECGGDDCGGACGQCGSGDACLGGVCAPATLPGDVCANAEPVGPLPADLSGTLIGYGDDYVVPEPWQPGVGNRRPDRVFALGPFDVPTAVTVGTTAVGASASFWEGCPGEGGTRVGGTSANLEADTGYLLVLETKGDQPPGDFSVSVWSTALDAECGTGTKACGLGETCDAEQQCQPFVPGIAGDTCDTALTFDTVPVSHDDSGAGPISASVMIETTFCSPADNNAPLWAPDRVAEFVAPAAATYEFGIVGGGADLYVLDSCEDASSCLRRAAVQGTTQLAMEAGQAVALVMRPTSATATWTLTIDEVCTPTCGGSGCLDGCGGLCPCAAGEFCSDVTSTCLAASDVTGNSCGDPIVVDALPWQFASPWNDFDDTFTAVGCGYGQPLGQGHPDVAFELTAPETRTYLIRAWPGGSGQPLVVTVHQGCGAGATCLALGRGVDAVELEVQLEAGQTYSIVTDGSYSTDGKPEIGGGVIEVY